MLLTEKCKEDFEQWYNSTYQKDGKKFNYLFLEDFYKRLSLSMQYGVLVDFFDSIGIYISDMVNIYHLKKDEPKFQFAGYETTIDAENFCQDLFSDTRTEARQKTVEKANELYNEKYK